MGHLVLSTQQLDYLVAIDRAGTWAEAAATLGVSASALSQGVAELERRLGVSLFERDGRRRVPGRDHAEVLRYAQQVIAATRDLERWLDRRRGGRVGAVRLGMIDAAATHHFRAELLAFRAAHPEVELHLTVAPSGELLQRVGRGELDIAACVEPASPPVGIDLTPVLDDPLDVLAPPGADLDVWGPWVTFPSGSHTRQVIDEALRAAGARFDVVAESHQPEVLREMVVLGIGWTVLPRTGSTPTDDLRLVHAGLAARRIALARRTGSTPDAATEALIAALLGAA